MAKSPKYIAIARRRKPTPLNQFIRDRLLLSGKSSRCRLKKVEDLSPTLHGLTRWSLELAEFTSWMTL